MMENRSRGNNIIISGELNNLKVKRDAESKNFE